MITVTVSSKGFYDTQGERFVLLDVGDKCKVLEAQPKPSTKSKTGVWAVTTKDIVVFLEDGNFTLPTSAEQMALYEADLKENDWGHQPC
jgi:hypothetical protein